MDIKLRTIIKNKNFPNFWECFDFMTLLGYSEVESLMVSSDIFEGKIWDRVIGAKIKELHGVTINGTGVGAQIGRSNSLLVSDTNGHSAWTDGNLAVEVYLLTDKSNENFKEIYKSYVETEKYETVNEIEGHIKTLNITLTTELAQRLFKDGKQKIKLEI